MATDAERAFQRKVREILAQADQLTDDAIRRAIDLAEQLRQQVLDELTRLPVDSFTAAHLRALRQGIDQVLSDLVSRYGQQLPELFDRAHELGIDLIDDPLGMYTTLTPNLSLGMLAPIPIARTSLEILQAYSADLIKAIADEARRKITATLAQAALGVVSPHDAMLRIAGDLPGKSIFKSLEARAEAIYRTETGRVFSMAADTRMQQIGERVPGMKKGWQAVMDMRTRPTHAIANGQVVPVKEPFDVGGFPGMYPRDPALPPQESINCRCWAVPVIDEAAFAQLTM